MKERRAFVSKTSTLKKVLGRIKRYRLSVLLSFLLSMISVALILYVPVLIGKAIDLILGVGRVDFSGIGELLIRVLIISFVISIIRWIISTINNNMTYNVVKDIRNEAFEKIGKLPIKYIDSKPYGDIISRVISDVDQFADGLLTGTSQLFTGLCTILGTLFFMLSINYKITVLVVVLTPISLFVARFIAKHTYYMFKKQSEIRAEQTAFIDETIGNQKVIKAFSREDEAIKKFDEINKRLEKASVKAIFFSSLTNPCTRFVNSVVYAGVGLLGALFAISGGLTVGGLSCFLSYANQYTKPFNEISGVITELQSALSSAARIFEFIEAEEMDENETEDFLNASGKVTFSNVSFSYTRDRSLIENLSLDVKPGERIAIVGPTGCGKTTLINLLMRFYDVDKGKIEIDGKDIIHINRKELRKNYGMVLQETWLKSGTVKENIAFGKSDATDEEIVAAAKASFAHGFIKRLPHGYDTVLKGEGEDLSQGQKQLLCIARVMLLNPPILILDEATSSIDTRTEQKIQRAFEALMKGKTSFIVAHRLMTIKKADKILVMNDGNIVEQGTHKELLDKNGFYSKLYNSQF